ncbi:MAG: alpha/beta hydrolase [Pseudomonadota bacterium]
MGAFALAGCGPRALDFMAAPDGGVERDIVLLTNRAAVSDTGLSSGRTLTLSATTVTTALPPDRAPGSLPWNDPALGLRGQSPAPDLAAALAAQPPGPTTVWVHGFNNSPAEALYRHAQMAEDLALPGAQVSFVWPSIERYRGYLHDRDSVLHARRPFLDAIRAVRAARPDTETFVVAHSMGTFLVMEALRAAALEGRPLAQEMRVVLLQPDIDPGVLEAQVADIGRLPERMAIFTAVDDPALRLSARLAGQPARAGASATALKSLTARGVRVIDLGFLTDAADPHLAALTSPTALAAIRAVAAGSRGS